MEEGQISTGEKHITMEEEQISTGEKHITMEEEQIVKKQARETIINWPFADEIIEETVQLYSLEERPNHKRENKS